MDAIDSVLLIGFGGPTAPEEVMPFLERVVRGRNVPRERLESVAHHYYAIGGRSPYLEATLRQAAALEARLESVLGRRIPVYVGMRNWHPFLTDTIARMLEAGSRRAAGIVLAAHRSPTSVERYQLDVARAIEANGGTGPEIRYPEPWFDDPLFAEANAARIEEATGYRRGAWPPEVPVIFTAHSIPVSMASGSAYESDLTASCRGVAERLGIAEWQLAYQSRSGDPRVPWLEPDVGEVLLELAARGVREAVVHPIGFLHDHVEVLYDLDVEARATALQAGLRMHRSRTVEDHPLFIELLARLVARLDRGAARAEDGSA